MPGVGFLFWNVYRKPLAERVARLARSVDADVVVLVEVDTARDEFKAALSGVGPFRLVSDPVSEDIVVFSRLAGGTFTTPLRATRHQVLTFTVPGRAELLLAVTHLRSKLHADPNDQLLAAHLLARDIRAEEGRHGHTRTVLVGDLNMNPFETGVMHCLGLNAVSSGRVAARRTRTVSGEEHPLFYNPMWGVFGDRTPGPPGTYYRTAGEAVNYYWHVFDQVLLRPDVMDGLEELRVLDADGVGRLTTDADIPDKQSASDHLPLYFRLDW